MERLQSPGMWANEIPMALVWDKIEQDVDELFRGLARANEQRVRQFEAAQRRFKQDLNLAAWMPTVRVPAVFINGDAAQVYRLQLTQAMAQAQHRLADFDAHIRAMAPAGPRRGAPTTIACNEMALITLYVAQCYANLETCRQALCSSTSNRPVPKAWQQWAAIAAVIELVTAVVALTARAVPGAVMPLIAPTLACVSRWHIAGDPRASVRCPLLC